MQVKTSELSGIALDYVVAKLEGRDNSHLMYFDSQWHLNSSLRYSSNWVQSGPIIERGKIECAPCWDTRGCGVRTAFTGWRTLHLKNYGGLIRHCGYGETLLISAMRCYVSSKLGDVVGVPDSLIESDERQ